MNKRVSADQKPLGFDAVVESDAGDMLGYRHIPRRLNDLLSRSPPEWSVRMGLLGEWGSGKSTIAKWLQQLAERDGHLVAWLSPTGTTSLEELWAALAKALLDAADRHTGIGLAATARLRGFVTGRDSVRRLATAAQAHKIAQVLHSAASNFLQVGPNHLRDLRESLPSERRVIVVIDDLDRIDPKLLPNLLLALRDVLDLPGYAFLLPFDENVVAGALKHYNDAWSDGRRFLDKILDFRVQLPSPDVAARKRLFENEVRSAASFLDPEIAQGIESLLPPNPRRLKAIVRSLSPLAGVAKHHRPDEIDWRAVIFATLLRDEHEGFFHAYTDATFYTLSTDGSLPRNFQLERLMDKQKGAAAERERFEKLIQAQPSIDSHLSERLWDICDAWLKDLGLGNIGRAAYSIRLLSEPAEGATWADHDDVLCQLRAGADASAIARWIDTAAVERGVERSAISRSLVRAICEGYDLALGTAAETLVASQHAAAIDEANSRLEFLDKLVGADLPGLPTDEARYAAFSALLGTSAKWGHFRRNPGDVFARDRERALLLTWIQASGSYKSRFLASVRAVFVSQVFERIPGNDALRAALEAEADDVAATVLDRIRRIAGVSGLLGQNAPEAELQLLLNEKGPIWREGRRSSAAIALNDAAGKPEIQENARRLLDVILSTVQGRYGTELEERAKVFVASKRLAIVWRAATATPLQFRALHDLRKTREALMASGAGKSSLRTLPWMLQEA